MTSLRGTGEWMIRVGRAGLVAKGCLYAVVGLLSAQIAFGRPSSDASQEGAIQAVSEQPFGMLLVSALALGFAGYAVWRLAQAWLDPASEDGLKGLVLRVSFVVRGCIYGLLAVLAFREAFGGGGGSSSTEQSLTRTVMEAPWGPWLVGAVGGVLIGVGVYQASRARPAPNREELTTGSMSAAQERWGTRAGMVGHGARSVVFALAGFFLVRVALRVSSEQAVGLDAALRGLADAPYGPALLAVVAVGLLLYGVWCWVLARWGRIHDAS